MVSKVQLRGHCQCCGRQQAVIRGLMSKHGYTVESGWFKGVCQGQRFEPIEKDRSEADVIVKAVREECVSLRARAAGLLNGSIKPEYACSGNKVEDPSQPRWKWADEMVLFERAPKRYQQSAIDSEARNDQYRADSGERFASYLEKIANEFHGKALIEVELDGGPEPIRPGEQRKSPRGVLTVKYVEGARVYWKDGKFNSWTGLQAWRRMEKVS